jgi:hypothetical protein
MAQQIPFANLIKWKWYVGRGRNGNVGLWDGLCFLVIAEKFDDYVIKHEPYYTDDSGCFQPFAMVDEGRMMESFGHAGWDKHYGRRVEFGAPQTGSSGAGLVDSEVAGCWVATTYRWDGDRMDHTLLLRPEQRFEWLVREQRDGKILERKDWGTWIHERVALLLHFKSENTESEYREFTWCILGFTGTTLLLRWLVRASRNLPVLFYRIHGTESPG